MKTRLWSDKIALIEILLLYSLIKESKLFRKCMITAMFLIYGGLNIIDFERCNLRTGVRAFCLIKNLSVAIQR